MAKLTSLLNETRPGKIKAAPVRKVCSVRPESDAEREQWQAIADQEGVSLHSLMLFAIRRTVQQLEAGELVLPMEDVTTKRIKMP